MRVSSTEFSRKIIVQKRTIEKDEMLADVEIWNDYYECYAGVITNGGRVSVEESRPDTNFEIEFKLRYCFKALQIDSIDYRVVCNGRIYKILSAFDVNSAHLIIKLQAVADKSEVTTHG